MPDDFGTIYEGIVSYAAQRLGHQVISPFQADLVLGCRITCQNRVACTATGNEPKLYIKPDLARISSKDAPVHIFYVTHWRNADNFQYKLWRTVAEIFEHKLHVKNAVAVNWLAEPLSQNQGLLDALGRLADHSFDPSQLQCTARASARMMTVIEEWADSLRPITISKVTQACRLLESHHDWARSYFGSYSDSVQMALASTPRYTANDGVWSVSRDGCLSARSRPLQSRSISTSYRSSAQLLALLLGSATAPLDASIAALQSGRSPESAGVPEGVLTSFRQAKFRTKLSGAVSVLQERKDIKGTRLTLSDGVLRLMARCDADILARIVERYVTGPLATPTWRAYVTDLAMTDNRRHNLRKRWPSWSPAAVRRLVKDALLGRAPRVLFDMILAATDHTIDGLQAAIAPGFHDVTGTDLKRAAPHGDTGRHVFRMLLTGQASAVRPVAGKTLKQTIDIVASLAGKFLASVEAPDPAAWEYQAALQKALGFKMRTFLSKAPNPLLSYVERSLPPGWISAKLQATILNDLQHGKTGKTDYDFGSASCFIKVVTAQDGNEEHKTKELCGRLRCQRVRAATSSPSLEHCKLEQFRAVLVLDGDWSSDNIEALLLAGYDDIFEAGEVGSARWKESLASPPAGARQE